MDFWSVLTICITTVICTIIYVYGQITVASIENSDKFIQ